MASYGSRPVPQNIMNVEFKLFELVTIKQFIFSFVIVLICGLFFYIGSSPFWKIFVPGLILIIGFLFVYVPFNGEPFSNFVSYYMEALISPQRRIWNKKGIVVKSAFKAVKDIRYGNDPDEEENSFKFTDTDTVSVNNNTKLDKQEEQFLQTGEEINQFINGKLKDMNNDQQNNGDYSHTSQINKENLGQRIDLNSFPENNSSQDQYVQKNADNPDINLSNASDTSNQTYKTGYLQKEEEAGQPQINFPTQQTQNSQQPLQQQPQINSSNNQASYNRTVQQHNNTQQAGNTNVDSHQLRDKVDNNPMSLSNEKSFESQMIGEEETEGYITGTVNFDEEPVVKAAVVIKKENKNLEIVYTNSNGEFKSNFEHKKGKYNIYVNHDSKEIANEEIDFNPSSIDLIDINVYSQEGQKQRQQEAGEPVSHQNNPVPSTEENTTLQQNQAVNDQNQPGVFTGDYNFNNADYYNAIPQPSNLPLNHNQPQFHNTPPPQVQNNNSAYDPNPTNSPYPHTNQNSQEGFYNQSQHANPIQNTNTQPQSQQSQIDSTLSQPQEGVSYPLPPQTPTSTSNPPISQNNYGSQNQLAPNQTINPNSSPPQSRDKNFLELPINENNMNHNFIFTPNTLNGVVTDASNMLVPNALIAICDANGNVVRNLATDMNGQFYSYSPLNNGRYTLNVSINGINKINLYTDLNGSVIKPRDVKIQ